MSNNIKGITVEIGGDTGPLSNALKGVNKTAGDLQSELREVNKQLKFDPANTELLTQKQTILTKEIDSTKQKLTTLKETQKQVEQQFQSGKLGEEKYRAFQRELEKTESQLKSLEKQAAQSNVTLQKISVGAQKVADGSGKVASKMAPVTLAIAGVGAAAVKTGDDFEEQMSRVSAISGATGDDLKALNNQALQLGQDTAFSASEVAEGMENLASAGFSTKEIMSAMPGMLNLAASSGEDLASSADIAASTLRGFNLAADQSGHVADVLAKNAADTNAAVADTGEAMKYIAPVAQNAGWSLEQVTAAIGEMANAGIKGEQAGTTLRGALTSLMNPSKEQADAMKAIGFSAYDAQGKMKPLSQIIGELGTKTKGLTNEQRDNAVATIMGTNSLSGMQVLLKDGSGSLDKLTSSLKNSDGAAAKMANTMQGNAKGAIEQMKGALETAAIKIQQLLAPIITQISQKVSELVSQFSALSPATQKIILIIVGLVAAIAPVAKVIQGTADGIRKLINIAQSIPVIIKAVSAATKALFANPTVLIITAIVAAIALLVVGIKHLWDTNEGFRNAVTGMINGIKQAWNSLVSFFAGIPAWWSNLWTQVGQFFTNFWNGIVSFFTQSIPAFIASVGQWFQQLPYNIGLALGTAIRNIINFGTAAWSWVTTQLPQIINGIIQWFQQLPGRIWTALTQVIAKIGQWITGMGTQVATGVPSLINRIGTWFSQLPGKIWTALLSALQNVKKWCTNLISTAATEIPKFVSSAVGFFQQLPGKMLDIGKNVVYGIWNGITSAGSWLWGKITGWCNDFVAGFKKGLGIHSPSKLFADVIGKNLALGIGQGFQDNISSVVSSMMSAIPIIPDSGPQVRTAMAAAYGGYSAPALAGTGGTGSIAPTGSPAGDVKVYQYFQGKTPSPAEHARLTRNSLQQVVKKLKG